ncbi:MAG TPA: hypothetical protein VHE55_05370 [Fimbriimonadaceae bacterium]|nr:hypothetical protein [Fimbriimonadaceae bacterium]
MGPWNGKWVGYLFDPRRDLGVFAFRRRFRVEGRPDALPVKLSADNRYKLYVNGEMAAFGPQRGDERHWFYDHFDLAPYLREGDNEIVALVWNFGRLAPMAQHTVRTAFVFDGQGLETPGEWVVGQIEDWDFEIMHSTLGEFYIDVGPGEIIGPRGLSSVGEWREPHVICSAEERGTNSGGTPWMLIPRTLPAMRYERRERRPVFRTGFVGDASGESDGLEAGEIVVAPGKPVLLDYGELLCAYPRLVAFSPVAGQATLTLTYAEAMWTLSGEKGNRDEVRGKEMRGYQDRFVVDDKEGTFEPLWWRTYRYVLIEAGRPSTPLPPSSFSRDVRPDTPGGERREENEEGGAVVIRSLDAIETGYPYEVESSFEADDAAVERIWDVSVRTAARCAGETYFDCPYYEQLQYAGDTRIQALIGYYLGWDRRLQRNAIENLGWSMMENGLTQSRYPSRQTQVIPPFSLWWMTMLYDQMLYDDIHPDWDEKWRSPFGILSWHWRRHVEKLPSEFWPFTDWCPEWPGGVPPGELDHPVAILLESMAEMVYSRVLLQKGQSWSVPGMPRAIKTGGTIRRVYAGKWPGAKVEPCEHTEALWRCLQVLSGEEPDPWPTEELARATRCTYYFSYYKHLAMSGREDTPFDYVAELQPWKQMIEDGLSTFAENPEPTRSDCHAWSAHPILGFFQIVAGVTSTAPRWMKARIAPKPGSLKRFDARIAHPLGELRVAFEDGRLEVDTPVPAELRWQGKKKNLKPGRHRV